MYQVVRQLAGEWYVQSEHESEEDARAAAIAMTFEANREYINDPYAYGVRAPDGEIITEDAAADDNAEWNALTPEQQAAEHRSR